jgi:hypothetical protein
VAGQIRWGAGGQHFGRAQLAPTLLALYTIGAAGLLGRRLQGWGLPAQLAPRQPATHQGLSYSHVELAIGPCSF